MSEEVDPSTLDAADTDVVNPPGWVPDVVAAEPLPEDVRDEDEDADA
jgi:hypothetical protein